MNEITQYLETKFARQALKPSHRRMCIKGIKKEMWFRVVKPELQRIAANHQYALKMLVEKPSNNFIEFEIVQIPLPTLSRVSHQPPLKDSELRDIRSMLKEWRYNVKRSISDDF